MHKRAYGTGSIRVRHNAYYGEWRTPDGRRVARKIGTVKVGREGLSKKQAEEKLREMIITEAERVLARRASGGEVQVLGAALVARLEAKGRKASHIESVHYHLVKHINPLLGDLDAGDVLASDVQKLVARMVRDGLAPKTIRNVIGTLHAVLAVGVKDNPVDMAELPLARSNKVLRFLTGAEIDRVISTPLPKSDEELMTTFPPNRKKDRRRECGPQTVRDWWPTVRILVLTAAMSGLRLGELLALRWEDLDFGAMKIRVRWSFVRGKMDSPKSQCSIRAVPLATRLVDELERHHRGSVWNQDGDLVFAHPHTGRPLDRVRLLLHFKAALARAGVRSVRIHDLRHTFATTVAASGEISIRTLQEWMGHEDIRTTQIYADYMPAAREQEMLDAAFGGAKVTPPAEAWPIIEHEHEHEPVIPPDLRA